MKKQKDKKSKKPKWKVGDKVRDITVDSKENKIGFLVSIILANVILLTASIYYMIVMKEWYYILLAIAIILSCGVYSYFIFRRSNFGRRYTLYDNCIELTSLWRNRCIRYENIELIERTDDLLVIYENKIGFNKSKVRYIREDLDALKDEMIDLINTHMEKMQTIIETTEEKTPKI
ncbi:MAG: hypothetical protein ACLRFL_02230 [Clostridia bacterium]